MASKIKEVHQYDGTQWGQAVPIGADATNVDVRTSDNTDIPLQSVLGSFNATEPSIKTQINGKVDKEGGDVAHAIINDPLNEIPIYDLDAEETSEKLISDDISTDTDMVVMSGDGENLTTMWGKFNRFRKRVDNKFKNYLVTSLEGVAPGASSDTKGYSTQALNNYFNDVIGYTSAASVSQVGKVSDQLRTLTSSSTSATANINNIYDRFRRTGYWTFSNSISMTPVSGLNIAKSANGQTLLTYEKDADGKLLKAYDSGGIHNLTGSKIRLLITYHLTFSTTIASGASVSSRYVYVRIISCPRTSGSTWARDDYIGTYTQASTSGNIVASGAILYTCPANYRLGIAANLPTTVNYTAATSTSGRVNICPIMFYDN